MSCNRDVLQSLLLQSELWEVGNLLPTGMGQHAAVLQDEQGLGDARLLLGAFLRRGPVHRLQLHLAVDARKVPALLQDGLQGKQNSDVYRPPLQ